MLWKGIKIDYYYCANVQIYLAQLLRGKMLLGHLWADDWEQIEKNYICISCQIKDTFACINNGTQTMCANFPRLSYARKHILLPSKEGSH